MAVAASLNVNLTATSGQFTSTMTKATATMQKVGSSATAISRAVRGFATVAIARRAFGFITHAVGDVESLAKSAEHAGYALSKMERTKLGSSQLAAEKVSGAFDKMKLQLVAGLGPAIQKTSELMTWFTSQGVNGFSLMELAGRAVGAGVIVIGKGFQITAKIMSKALAVVSDAVAGLSLLISDAADALGDFETAATFRDSATIAEQVGRDLRSIDASLDWKEIFSWPEFKATADDIIKTKQKIEAPTAIGFGSQESALLDNRRRESMLRAVQNRQQKPDDKQAALLTSIKGLLAKIEKNTSEEQQVFTG